MAARRGELKDVPGCCCHDLVQRTRKGENDDVIEEIGLVWRVAGEENSDDEYAVSSEDEEDLPPEESANIPDGHAQVAWIPSCASSALVEAPLSQEQLEEQNLMDTACVEELTVVDRSFATGDIIASTSDPVGMTAVVLDVHRLVDVELSDGGQLERQPTSNLTPIVPHYVGQHLLCLGWLGKVDEVYEALTVQLDDGSTVDCLGYGNGPPNVMPLDPHELLFREEGSCRFHPGQRVVLAPDKIGGSLWAQRRRQQSKIGTVTHVRVQELLVDWLVNIGGHMLDRPDNVVSPAVCKVLREVPYQVGWWHLGIRAFWKVPEAGNGGAPPATPAADELALAPMDTEAPESPGSSGRESEEAEPKPPAGWATSLAQRLIALPSTGLTSQGTQKKSRKRKARKKQAKIPLTARIVRTHTTVDVVWQSGEIQRGLPSTELLPRFHLDEHDFWQDDIVELVHDDLETSEQESRVGLIRSCNPKERTAVVAWLSLDENGFLQPFKMGDPTETLPVYRLQGHPDFNYQAGDIVLRLDLDEASGDSGLMDTVGEVVDGDNGLLKIRLASGATVWLAPDRVAMAAGPDYHGSGEDGDDMSESSWSTCSDEAEFTDEQALALPPAEEAGRKAAVTEGSQRSPCLAAEVGKVSLASPPAQQSEGSPCVTAAPSAAPTAASEAKESLPQPATNGPASVSDAPGVASAQPPAPASEDPEFPHFSVEEDCPADHAFKEKSSQVSRRFQSAVLAEWKSLAANLPSSIWVRGYESRMDLMRFAVLAAAGTPYAGHLFLFDLHLPPDYPATPPQVLYHSWGLRVNPNLYENGKVCLSLLGTWTGNKQEMWTPESTLLQLVVSIQGLILVPKPYFNEAGFEKQTGSVEGEKNSVLYNEQAFLLTIRSSIHLLRRPPTGFEAFIKGYYKRHRDQLLGSCTRLLSDDSQQDAANGSQQQSGTVLGEETVEASAGFRLMLRELLPKFRATLEQL